MLLELRRGTTVVDNGEGFGEVQIGRFHHHAILRRFFPATRALTKVGR